MTSSLASPRSQPPLEPVTAAFAAALDGPAPDELSLEEPRARSRHPPLAIDPSRAGAAVEALADRALLPVHVEIPEQRYPALVESAAYFVAAEALTNVAKYAKASTA
jgi:hypothetical protein